jgi:hypothetical protein
MDFADGIFIDKIKKIFKKIFKRWRSSIKNKRLKKLIFLRKLDIRLVI